MALRLLDSSGRQFDPKSLPLATDRLCYNKNKILFNQPNWTNQAGPSLQSPEILAALVGTPFVMAPSRMVQSEFPTTRVPVNVVVISFALLTLLRVIVDLSTVDDPMVEVVHVDFIMWLLWTLQSVREPSEQSDWVKELLVLVQSAAKLWSTVDKSGFSEQEQDLLTCERNQENRNKYRKSHDLLTGFNCWWIELVIHFLVSSFYNHPLDSWNNNNLCE